MRACRHRPRRRRLNPAWSALETARQLSQASPRPSPSALVGLIGVGDCRAVVAGVASRRRHHCRPGRRWPRLDSYRGHRQLSIAIRVFLAGIDSVRAVVGAVGDARPASRLR